MQVYDIREGSAYRPIIKDIGEFFLVATWWHTALFEPYGVTAIRSEEMDAWQCVRHKPRTTCLVLGEFFIEDLRAAIYKHELRQALIH